jgi:hypothetical protein
LTQIPEKPLLDIETIKARLEICNLKARHLRLLDTKDWAGYAGLLTEDFVLDISEGTNIPVTHGRDAAMKQIQASVGSVKIVHQAHTPEFDFNGDEAHVIWAMQDRVIRAPDQPSLSGYGHHHDRWKRRNGVWKLAAQRLTRLHVDVLPPVSAPKPSGSQR